MKLTFILFTLVLITICEARYTESFTHNIVDTITNKTSQFTNYVKAKGRSLKQFYVDNVKNKITSYLGWAGKNETIDVGSDVERANRRFKGYLDEAEANNQIVFDAIAPEKAEYNYNDDDPTIHMTTPQLIAANGYHSESHTIVTDDGYILTVHRIPYSKKDENKVVPKRTVLCHHGLLGSSVDWVMAGPEKGLGYILSDAGYDVWLANVRGNTYSRAHVSLNTDTFHFWNFTFHEVAQHDLPAVINYIMDLKGKDAKIDYIGHSMGTTILFALLSTKPEYNDILRAGFALAPVAYMTDIRSPINLLARYSSNLEYLLKLLGANEFLPQNSVLRWLSRHACEINHWEEAICENSLFVICGHDSKQFNKTLLPMILGHTPAGASTKTLVHYAQEIRNAGRFQQFDYGEDGNLREYGTDTPPAYPLHKITLPVALFGALNDWLASDKDVTELYVQLANPIEHYIVPLKEFNHIDFLYAIDAPTLVYDKLLQLMRRDLGKFRIYSEPVVQNYL
ncbi:lipase 3-like [Aricia agestis]|uniref:lipase 3-like n=1 Tax=Aricia agestis TaxID=91739 RepID=UPI001C20332C|nr:lipase 3-like [Aricia agestis]